MAASAPRSLAVAVALGVADVLDADRQSPPAAIEEWAGEPDDLDAIVLELDPRPSRSRATVRRWLLDLEDPWRARALA